MTRPRRHPTPEQPPAAPGAAVPDETRLRPGHRGSAERVRAAYGCPPDYDQPGAGDLGRAGPEGRTKPQRIADTEQPPAAE